MPSENSRRILILSCSARKSEAPVCYAVDRYNSPSFFLVRRYLSNNPNNDLVIWILSAKYGLIGKKFRIETYDLAMTTDRAVQLKDKLQKQFFNLYRNNFDNHDPKLAPSEVFCHLPQNYRDALSCQLAFLSGITTVNFALGRPGEKLRDLKKWREQKQEVAEV